MKYLVVLMLGVIISCGADAGSFMEENDLWQEDSLYAGSITESEFNAIIKEFENVYNPIFSRMGRTLSFQKRWADPTVNAYNSTQGAKTTITMFGGLARRSEVTYDGFRMVVCHEIGHTIGGYPFYAGESATNEGQSDYFSANGCAKSMFPMTKEYAQMLNNAWAKKYCAAKETDISAQKLCYRIMMAGKSLANLLGSLQGAQANFSTPDQTQVTKMSDSHPKAQCRLDTYVAGISCKKVWPVGSIPKSRTEEQNSQCAKPRCWYK